MARGWSDRPNFFPRHEPPTPPSVVDPNLRYLSAVIHHLLPLCMRVRTLAPETLLRS